MSSYATTVGGAKANRQLKVSKFKTVEEMLSSTLVTVGDKVETAEFSTGNGGGATYDVVQTSTIEPLAAGSTQGANVIRGVANPLISFVLRVVGSTTALMFGVKHSVNTAPEMLAAMRYYAANGGRLIIPYPLQGGRYMVDSPLSVSPVASMSIDCDEGVVIDMTASTTEQDGLKLRAPALSDTASLIANAYQGDRVISSTLAASLKQGDVIKLVSTDNFTPETLENLGSGEFAEVSSISGSDIRLMSGLNDDYLSSTTSVGKMSGVSVSVRNLKVVRDIDNGKGIDVRNCINVKLDKCDAVGAKERGIWIRNCYNVLVSQCSANSLYTNTVNTNYGIAVDSSDHVVVDGGSYCSGRHGVKTGSVAGEGIGRFITYKNLNASNVPVNEPSSKVACLDAHDVCDYITVENCKVANGMTLQAPNVVVKNNTIKHDGNVTSFNTMLYYWPLNTAGTAVIEGNILKGKAENANDYGIRINIGNANFSDLTIKSIKVSKNTIENVGTPLSVYSWTATGSKIKALSIIDNDLIAPSKNVIKIGDELAPRTRTIDTLTIDSNRIEGQMKLNHDGVTTIVSRNALNGLDLFSSSDFGMDGDLILTQNSLSKFTDAKAGIDITSAYLNNIVWQGNVVNSAGFIAFPFPRRAIVVGDSPFGIVSADSSQPRGGKWSIYDTVIDSSPAVYKGWTVSAAGYAVQGAWASDTQVIAGRQFTYLGNIYRVVKSGLTGIVPPTFLIGEAVDGTSILEFVATSSEIAVFTPYGALAP